MPYLTVAIISTRITRILWEPWGGERVRSQELQEVTLELKKSHPCRAEKKGGVRVDCGRRDRWAFGSLTKSGGCDELGHQNRVTPEQLQNNFLVPNSCKIVVLELA